jgi:hypothetical protein
MALIISRGTGWQDWQNGLLTLDDVRDRIQAVLFMGA